MNPAPSVRDLLCNHDEVDKIVRGLFHGGDKSLQFLATTYIEYCVHETKQNVMRFTWKGDAHGDAHKTFEERPGYASIALDLFFFWKFLALALLATLFHLSGGHLAFLLARLIERNTVLLMRLIERNTGYPVNLAGYSAEYQSSVQSTLEKFAEYSPQFAQYSPLTGGLEDKWAPNWLGAFASLAIYDQIAGLLRDLLWLRRAASVDTKGQHAYWERWTRCNLVERIGRAKRFINAGLEDSEEADDAAAKGCTEQLMRMPFDVLRRGCNECWRSIGLPLSWLAMAIAFAVTSVAKAVDGTLLLLPCRSRWLPALWPVTKVVGLAIRIAWIGALLITYGHGQAGAPLFLCLVCVQAWASVLLAGAEAIFARVDPDAEICCGTTARDFFGWWFEYYEYVFAEASQPRHRKVQR